MINKSVFVYPTETSYGIGCDARNAESVQRIIAMKKRPDTKSLPLIAANIKMVEKYADVRHKEIQRVMKTYWPGPLTLIVRANAFAKKTFAPHVIAPDGTIAIRVPANDIARDLSKEVGAPIVSTSANLSGKPACYSITAVKKMFKNADDTPDVVFDTGRLKPAPASTIAHYKKGKWEIIRPGSITNI